MSTGSLTLDQLEAELSAARQRVINLEDELARRERATRASETQGRKYPLSKKQYIRYGRQMILPSVGIKGQLALDKSRVLVVGAGGLGCPVLMYLAGAGVGHITILDHDTVDLSNLHRQVLHSEATVGINKADSAQQSLARLNSDITISAYPLAFTPSLFATPSSSSSSATPPQVLAAEFDVLLDCTDNPATRHFLNAYAIAHRIPLVSGGAVRTEGTVGVYGSPLVPAAKPRPASDGSEAGTSTPIRESDQELLDYGPCYACLFPPPPPRGEVSDEQSALQGTGACSDEGVLGVLCGMVGLVMAAEATKVLLQNAKPTVHLLSPLSPTPVRTLKIRPRKPTCPACARLDPSSPNPAERWAAFVGAGDGAWPGWEDPLCGLPAAGDSVGAAAEPRVSARALSSLLSDPAARRNVRVIDTRPAVQFAIAHVPGSENVPLARLLRDPAEALARPTARALLGTADAGASPAAPADRPGQQEGDARRDQAVYLICRRGNDSLVAARALRRHLAAEAPSAGDVADDQAPGGRVEGGRTHGSVEVLDVKGGLVGWAREVDDEFPVY